MPRKNARPAARKARAALMEKMALKKAGGRTPQPMRRWPPLGGPSFRYFDALSFFDDLTFRIRKGE